MDYDGVKYKKHQFKYDLLPKIEKTSKELTQDLLNVDREIFQYFHHLAMKKNLADKLKNKYDTLFQLLNNYEKMTKLQETLYHKLEFLTDNLEVSYIINNFKNLKPMEQELKKVIKELIENPLLKDNIYFDTLKDFKRFTENEFTYFFIKKYKDDELKCLYSVLNNFVYVYDSLCFYTKKDLMDFQKKILKENGKI